MTDTAHTTAGHAERKHSARRKGTAAALRKTAFHEAGHAVMAVWLGFPIRHATIKQDGDSLGSVVHRRIPRWLESDAEGWLTPTRAMWMENKTRCLLAVLAVIRKLRFLMTDNTLPAKSLNQSLQGGGATALAPDLITGGPLNLHFYVAVPARKRKPG